MSKHQIVWCTYVVVFVLPSALYFIVNGYWWLFDGNQPIVNKKGAALIVVISAGFIAAMWADLEGVW